eukprot:2368445-Prymnesium_polylepis.1
MDAKVLVGEPERQRGEDGAEVDPVGPREHRAVARRAPLLREHVVQRRKGRRERREAPRAAPLQHRVAALEGGIVEREAPHPDDAADDHRRLVALLPDVRQRAVEGGRSEAYQEQRDVDGNVATLEALAPAQIHAHERCHNHSGVAER